MKISEILTKYVHPDVNKILNKYERRAKGRATMGYHSMMAYPYKVEGWAKNTKDQSTATIQKASHKRLIVQAERKNENCRNCRKFC